MLSTNFITSSVSMIVCYCSPFSYLPNLLKRLQNIASFSVQIVAAVVVASAAADVPEAN